MIEVLAVLTLGVLLLTLSRKRNALPAEGRTVFAQPGKQRIRLMPGLEPARPFIETVSRRIGAEDAACCSATHYFSVGDRQVVADGFAVYLLAISYRHGTPYFQAALPLSDNPGNYLDTIREYAGEVLGLLPAACCRSEKLDARIDSTIRAAAVEQGVDVALLRG